MRTCSRASPRSAPDLIVLAGFMRILDAAALAPWIGRMINIHPSLLPKYRGLHTHRRALEAGDAVHGASVHFVTAELDGGPVIAQVRHSRSTPATAGRAGRDACWTANTACWSACVAAARERARGIAHGRRVLRRRARCAAPLRLDADGTLSRDVTLGSGAARRHSRAFVDESAR